MLNYFFWQPGNSSHSLKSDLIFIILWIQVPGRAKSCSHVYDFYDYVPVGTGSEILPDVNGILVLVLGLFNFLTPEKSYCHFKDIIVKYNLITATAWPMQVHWNASWDISDMFNRDAIWHIDGLVQERCNSSALAIELRLSCTNPSIWSWSSLVQMACCLMMPSLYLNQCWTLKQISTRNWILNEVVCLYF